MSILVGHRLTQFYGAEEIFADINVEVAHGARIALVGPNGAGKTTLLNILIGAATATSGEVTRARGVRVGHLPQRPELFGERTIWEEMLSAFATLREQEAALKVLENRLANANGDGERLLAEYGELQHQFELAGGYTYEQRIRTVLHGLSFTPDQYERRLEQLSGGQKTRALLARLLLEAPDILALDEPTNHLDIGAIEWLEGYLREFPGAIIAISHDRYFMDAMAKTVWELDFGALETYRGNYSAYVNQREERHTRLLVEYEAQQAFIQKEEAYIRKNIAGQNVAQAKGRRTRLARMMRDEAILKPRTRQHMHLKMGQVIRSGELVIRTYGLQVGYADAPALFSTPDITLRRGEVAALIGPNGAGKSTLVKTLIGQLAPKAGEVKPGTGVQIGYFAQAQELLDDTHTILDEITAAKPMGNAEARSFLGKFLFSGDDVFRTISSLSGGERGRVALAKLALCGANLLLLDEPTNHLDIPSQEILQNVLADFEGTILLVTHDRYLVAALATQIWSLEPAEERNRAGELRVFSGTYGEYLAAREAQRQQATDAERAAREAAKSAPVAAKTSAKKHGLNPYQLEKRLAEVEAQIAAHEARIQQLTDEIGQASSTGDAARVQKLGEAYTQAQGDLERVMGEWLLLAE